MPVLVAFGSLVTTLLGGVAALRIGDRRHLVLGLAAGLMLGVVLFDLLPEALGEQPEHLFGVPVVMLAAMAGFLALHVIERSAPVHRGHEAEYAGHQHHPGVGILAASGLVGHSLMDGFAIGAAFQAGSTAPVTGAAITLAFTISPHVLGLYLGFFAGILLYLATSDILPEAHASHPTRLTLACTIAGAGFMWLVIGLAS
jgi:ZIP family zinc transporter